tara:strand:- start:877 stop:1503 length:627 start_codon:yes stop_codon:yes gene_type:complete
MKKAQALKFLFWIIVGLAFFIPACMLGTKFTKLGDDSIKSFSNLISTIESTGVDEFSSTGFSMKKKSVVVGFSKTMSQFENWRNGESTAKSIFEKPSGVENGCIGGSACVCLCQGYELDTDPDPSIPKQCELLICHPFETIDIVPEKVVNPDYTWKGGFIIHREIDHSEEVSGSEKNNIGARTFYVERKQDVVGICTEDPSITPCIPP